VFTGLVEALGEVREVRDEGPGRRLVVAEGRLAGELTLGESVAVNGVCLTVVAHEGSAFAVEVGPETLARTNLGGLQPGERVNLERALRVGDRLGGHWVQGHVDGVGRIAERRPDGPWETVWFACPHDLSRYMVPKGSVAVDGISLTLVEVRPEGFSVMLIPHTLAATTLGFKAPGTAVNLETDLLAKYLWQWAQPLLAR
jgi:riboflavin synthase